MEDRGEVCSGSMGHRPAKPPRLSHTTKLTPRQRALPVRPVEQSAISRSRSGPGRWRRNSRHAAPYAQPDPVVEGFHQAEAVPAGK